MHQLCNKERKFWLSRIRIKLIDWRHRMDWILNRLLSVKMEDNSQQDRKVTINKAVIKITWNNLKKWNYQSQKYLKSKLCLLRDWGHHKYYRDRHTWMEQWIGLIDKATTSKSKNQAWKVPNQIEQKNKIVANLPNS